MFKQLIDFMNAACDVTTFQLLLVFVGGYACHLVKSLMED